MMQDFFLGQNTSSSHSKQDIRLSRQTPRRRLWGHWGHQRRGKWYNSSAARTTVRCPITSLFLPFWRSIPTLRSGKVPIRLPRRNKSPWGNYFKFAQWTLWWRITPAFREKWFITRFWAITELIASTSSSGRKLNRGRRGTRRTSSKTCGSLGNKKWCMYCTVVTHRLGRKKS